MLSARSSAMRTAVPPPSASRGSAPPIVIADYKLTVLLAAITARIVGERSQNVDHVRMIRLLL